MMKIKTLLTCLVIIGAFASMGLLGFSTISGNEITYESIDLQCANATGATAMSNMTDTITELLTDVIPVFIILGVFGAVIGYVRKLSGGV